MAAIAYLRGGNWYSSPSGSAKRYESRTCVNVMCRQAFFGDVQTNARFCSVRCSRLGRGHSKGPGNPSWKGDSVTYVSSHFRVYRYRGKASSCAFGCTDVARFEWASLTGNLTNPDDYASMCARCHRRFDAAVRAMLKDGPWVMRTSLPGGL